MKPITSNVLHKRQSEDNKKHNTAITSLESFTALNKSGKRLREKQIVIEAIRQNQPVTSRSLSKITGIERTNITRTLYDLVHDSPAIIKEAFIGYCPETERRVKFYTQINWQKIEWIQQEIKL